MLWCVILGRTLSMMWLGSGGPVRPPCGPWQRHVELEHYEVLSVGPCVGASHLRLRPLLSSDLMLEICRIGQEAHDCYVEQYAGYHVCI